MAVHYRCPGCGAVHRARTRASRRNVFEWWNPHLGSTLERCGATGDWVSVGPAERVWAVAPRIRRDRDSVGPAGEPHD